MTLCDYFSATDDQAAAAVAEAAGGPLGTGLDVVSLKGIDPVVAVVQLDAILTGRTYEEAGQDPRSGDLLSSEEEPPFVFSLSDAFVDALAVATSADLVRVAGPWSSTAELRQCGIDARTALGVVEALAALAQRARSADSRLYCWWSL